LGGTRFFGIEDASNSLIPATTSSPTSLPALRNIVNNKKNILHSKALLYGFISIVGLQSLSGFQLENAALLAC